MGPFTQVLIPVIMIRVPTLFITFLGGLLWSFVPLFGSFHVDFAFISALGISFLVAVREAGLKRSLFTPLKNTFLYRLSNYIIWLLVFSIPIALHDVFRGTYVWVGFWFWCSGPVFSLILSATIGRYISLQSYKWPRVVAISAILFLAIGGWLVVFFSVPQLFYFNHIWGFWPGPIYDTTVRFTLNYLWFRLITLVLIFGFLTLAQTSSRRLASPGFIFALLFLAVLLPFFSNGALTRSEKSLQKTLSQSVETEHFELFASVHIPREELEEWALRHEFYFQSQIELLEIEWPENRKIHSYIYRDAWQKQQLVGAKETSFVPIWLSQDQLHIAHEHLPHVLEHEMVHVVAKRFGNILFNGSWNMVLVEGLAEAITQNTSPHSTLDQLVAVKPEYPTVDQMSSLFGLFGFYTQSSGLSYTVAGSFVSFLIDNYPIDLLKESYEKSRLSGDYLPTDQLVNQWHDRLEYEKMLTDTLDRRRSEQLFGYESIWEQDGPRNHNLPAAILDQWAYHWARSDTSAALDLLAHTFETLPKEPRYRISWFEHALELQKPELILRHQLFTDSTLVAKRLIRDAYAMSSLWAQAREINEELFVSSDTPTFFQDSVMWNTYIDLRYTNQFPSKEEYLGFSKELVNVLVFEFWDSPLASSPKDEEVLTNAIVQWLGQQLTGPIPSSDPFTFSNALIIFERSLPRLSEEMIDRFLNDIENHPYLSNELPRKQYLLRVQKLKDWIQFRKTYPTTKV